MVSATIKTNEDSMRTLKRAIVATSRRALAASKALLHCLRCTLSDVRRNRTLIEQEIYDGKYKLYSKNDDDLRIAPRATGNRNQRNSQFHQRRQCYEK